MTGFVNSDGSALVGGLLSTGVGKAFSYDELGNLPTVPGLEAAIRAGKVFVASSGFIALPASAGNYGISLYNPSNSGVGIYIAQCLMSWNNGIASVDMRQTTADPALATALTTANLKAGGAASAVAANVTFTNVAVSAAGTSEQFTVAPSNAMTNILPNGVGKYLPKGSGKGYAFYPYMSGGGYWGMVLVWIEI